MGAISELHPSEFPRTHQVLEQGLKDGVAPGFVVGVLDMRRPDPFLVTARGQRRVEPSPLPMRPDTIFDIASVSKVFATATLAGVLVERGWVSWNTRLSSIFPDYPSRSIELEHLLSHTAGFPWWEPFWEKLRAQFAPRSLSEIPVASRQSAMRKWIMACSPAVSPGERVEYSDVSFLLLGFALEEVTGMPLDRAVRRFLWEPMGLLDQGRGPYYRRTITSAAQINEDVAATELSPWHQTVLQGQVHDENCWAMGGYGGHAGVFARAEDLLRFSKALLDGFLSQHTLTEMWSRVSRPAGCERTRGWDSVSAQGSSAGRYFSTSSVGHLGFTGTSLWIDPQARLAVTLLSNRVHPTRENIKIRAFRPLLHDAVREDFANLGR
ncbi:MAG: serine hydrolase domain-containing protein [Bdellovibrionia bacterium]